MQNKKIQEQRTRGYFINAAKEILKAEGLNCISVRNIADKAGYSYATLYNYFKDLKDLIFECVKEFQTECETTIKAKMKKHPAGLHRIRAISECYIQYFVEYPGIFELFFIESTSELVSKQNTIELIVNFLDHLCDADWEHAIINNQTTLLNANQMKKQLKFVTSGMLLLYLQRNYPSDYDDFLKETKNQFNIIFQIN